MHDTRYQYTFAMTPGSLAGKDKVVRLEKTLRGMQNLRCVGGNHARFLYDFAPEAIVLRLTHDPARRVMLCFEESENGRLSLCRLLRRMKGTEPDVPPSEVVIGAAFDGIDALSEIRQAGCDGGRRR